MNDEGYKFSVNTSWLAKEDSMSIKEIISFEDLNDSEWMQLTEGEIGQLDDDENFTPLQLIRQNRNEPCNISVLVEDPLHKISKLTVISEARIIEYYGKHGEYICTEKGLPMGCIGGKKYFITQASVCATKELTLKLCSKEDMICLFGITLFVEPINNAVSNNSTIDFNNVDQILRSSNIHLSENAERAKSFIMNYNRATENKNGAVQNDSNNKSLQNLLETWNNLAGGGGRAGGASTLLANKLNTITGVIDVPNNNGNLSSCSSSSLNNTANHENGNTDVHHQQQQNDLKIYVDKKLQQLEERVQNNLQITLKEFEQKQNEKLDNIINLLQKK